MSYTGDEPPWTDRQVEEVRRDIEQTRMLQQIDRIERKVDGLATIVSLAASMGAAFAVSHELAITFGRGLISTAGLAVTYFGLWWLLRRSFRRS
jgi:hypothetical protein